MVFEQEEYVGDSGLSPVGSSTSTANVLASKRYGASGSSEGGLCKRIGAGSTTGAGEDGGGTCLDGGGRCQHVTMQMGWSLSLRMCLARQH
jgi:hypothetical protein